MLHATHECDLNVDSRNVRSRNNETRTYHDAKSLTTTTTTTTIVDDETIFSIPILLTVAADPISQLVQEKMMIVAFESRFCLYSNERSQQRHRCRSRAP